MIFPRHQGHLSRQFLSWLVLGGLLCVPAHGDDGIAFFESKIRPLLADRCHECHGPNKQKSGLDLSTKHGLETGGEGGVVIVPGDVNQSLLIEAVRYQNADLQMPPKAKLSGDELALLERWVRLGAPWPETPSEHLVVHRDPKTFAIRDEDRAYWAFLPVRQSAIPEGTKAEATSAIDRFINHELAERSLVSNGPASRENLVKRLYFDLLGLPPSVSDVQAFVTDDSPDAYERLTDRLLASPRHGERWGRHWLDVVRFAQTNGYERDDEKPEAWRYRDYVIDAFNADKPYDRFVMEQIAGDELADGGDEGVIATGFYRLGVWDDEPDDQRQAEMDELDDMIRVTSETFMGITTGCARCHHHMFDPISQQDYYAMQAFFRNVKPYEHPNYAPDSAIFTPIGAAEKVARWTEDWQRKRERLAQLSDDAKEQKRTLKDDLKAFRTNKDWGDGYALSVRERGGSAPATHVLIRGNAGRPGEEVQPAFPVVFGVAVPTLPDSSDVSLSTGRRAELARWIANPKHPLTARVLVNRIWQHHFGKGFVATSNDFGKGGMPPTHQALLDWLASDFVRHDHSIKHLHRSILLTDAYQRSSQVDSTSHDTDPGNDWLWRQNMRRLEAEVIRDRVLASTGQLHHAMGGRGFFPVISGEVISGGSRPGRGWGASSAEQEARRTVYTFIKRTMIVPLLESFDYSNTEGSLGVRTTTTVPTQALMLLNSEFVTEQSAILAKRLLAEGLASTALIRKAYASVLSREPTATEIDISDEFLNDQLLTQRDHVEQISFRPEIPKSVEKAFHAALPGHRFLVGPSVSWHYDKGQWGGEYEGILNVEPTLGPSARMAIADETVERMRGQFKVDDNVVTLGLLFGDLEVLIDRTTNRIGVRRHQGDKTTLLLEEAFNCAADVWSPFELSSSSIKLGSQTIAIGEQAVVSGDFGVRPWGGTLHLRDLQAVTSHGTYWVRENGVHDTFPDPEPLIRQRAVQQFCSLLFNLNEFVHVD